MDRSTDSEVLRAAVDWLEEGDAVALVTVARTWGSAPRRPGALMVIHADGRFAGSVSGGCVEDDLVQRRHGLEAFKGLGQTLNQFPVGVHQFALFDSLLKGLELLAGDLEAVFGLYPHKRSLNLCSRG